MVDNVLLEKRNRYLGKLIKKTHDLTESVKLLSTIDRELYSQSGGATLTQVVQSWLGEFTKDPKPSDTSKDIQALTDAIQKLEESAKFYIKDANGNMASMLTGHKPVVFYKLEAMGVDIQNLIKKLTAANVVFDEFELKHASELLLEIKAPAVEYITAVETYKASQKSPTSEQPATPKPGGSPVLVKGTAKPESKSLTSDAAKANVDTAYKKLQAAIKTHNAKPSYDLFLVMTTILYPEPQF